MRKLLRRVKRHLENVIDRLEHAEPIARKKHESLILRGRNDDDPILIGNADDIGMIIPALKVALEETGLKPTTDIQSLHEGVVAVHGSLSQRAVDGISLHSKNAADIKDRLSQLTSEQLHAAAHTASKPIQKNNKKLGRRDYRLGFSDDSEQGESRSR